MSHPSPQPVAGPPVPPAAPVPPPAAPTQIGFPGQVPFAPQPQYAPQQPPTRQQYATGFPNYVSPRPSPPNRTGLVVGSVVVAVTLLFALVGFLLVA
ncbi:hypothetical protein [Geodermatophilus marinus]|uniref:hypothetical protein n=1 Tax=Geodermatophilus sp. LHW52908 TaxID=2303986 RepID=UPI000E3BC88A|nr:hypothetical protein [Geodermatophilus sp. LHW52908]RFU20654.1 hypothetical protein D0Z06_15235 [Geodermatophilus sp. LHW52908]